MKKVSICIVTYNSESDILSVLESINNSLCVLNLEVFVVDCNSKDCTVDLVKKHFPQVRVVILPQNKGFGYAHNRVLDKLDSDFHIILNPDVTFNAEVLGNLVSYLEENSDVAIVTPKILNEDGSIQYLPKRTPKLKYLIAGRMENFGEIFRNWKDEYTRKNEKFLEPVSVDFCSGCFLLIRTSVFKQLRGFDERFFMYFEDADLTRRAKSFGKTIFHPDFCITHKWSRSSAKSLKYFFIHVSSMIKYFIKWH